MQGGNNSQRAHDGMYYTELRLPTIPEEVEPRDADGGSQSSFESQAWHTWPDSPLTAVSAGEGAEMRTMVDELVEMYHADVRHRDMHARFIREYVQALESQYEFDSVVMAPLQYLQSMIRPLREVVNGTGSAGCRVRGELPVWWGCNNEENCPPPLL